MRSAPRRNNSSSDIRRSGFSSDDFSTTLNMGGVSFSRLLTGMCVWNSHEGYAAFCHSGHPQHLVISPLWDLAAVYPKGARWDDRMPTAMVFDGPVVDVSDAIKAALGR